MLFRIIILSSLSFCFLTYAKAEKIITSQIIPNKFIVKFQDLEEDRREQAKRLKEKYGFEIYRVFDHSYRGASILVPDGVEKVLLTAPEIKKLVPDFTIYAHGEVEVSNQVIPTGIDRIDAELNTVNKGKDIKVAILDTGIDLDHSDLLVNNLRNKDLAGKVLDTAGDDNDSSLAKGHGTHIAGVIGAKDNNEDIRGVAPEVDLVPVKILDENGIGSIGSLIAGIDYVNCLTNEIPIANVSAGARGGKNPSKEFLEASELLHEAIKDAVEKRVIIVASSGNDSEDVTLNNVIPAMYPEVITVSALNDRNGKQSGDRWASFSNYGKVVDIIAPGVKILSTSNDGLVSTLSGTSLAAAHVSGTIALYLAKNGRPEVADSNFFNILINAISKPRSRLQGEPNDGFIEPVCYANNNVLK